MSQDREPRLDLAPASGRWVVAVVGLLAVALAVVGVWFLARPGRSDGPVALPSVVTASTKPLPTAPVSGVTLKPRHRHPRARHPLKPDPVAIPPKCALRPPRIVNVLQFNIHAGVSRTGAPGLSAIAAEIAAWRPDVVSLNEVDSGAARSGRVDEATYLARATGMNVVYGPNLVQAGGHRFGNAILTRFPVRASNNTHLPRARGAEPRGLLHAVLAVDGRMVDFYSVHLTQGRVSGLGPRIQQAQAMVRVLAAGQHPTIVAGDLNSPPGSLPVRILRGYLLDAQEQAGVGSGDTVPEGAPVNRIDYVLYDNHFRPTPQSTEVLASSSDHRAVRSELILLPGRHC